MNPGTRVLFYFCGEALPTRAALSLPGLAWWECGRYLVARMDAFIVLVHGGWGGVGGESEQIQRVKQSPSSKEILSPEQSSLHRGWRASHAKPSLLSG